MKDHNNAPSFKAPLTIVDISNVTKRNIPITAKALGTIVAANMIDMKSQTEGIVEKIYFKSGDYVKQGQLLFSLNDTQQKSELSSAKVSLWQDRLQYNRYKTLYNKNNAITLEQLDASKSQYEQALAKYNTSEYLYENTHIKTPFTGFVGATVLAVGSYVSPGDALVKLVDKYHLYVEYSLPEALISKIKLNQKVSFKTNAYADKKFYANVSYISPYVDENNLTFTVRASYLNKTNLLAPGMSVSINQILKQDNKVLTIPEISLLTKSGGFIVYTVENGKVKAIPVEIGQVNKGYVSILKGLKEHEKIIVSAVANLAPGQKVQEKQLAKKGLTNK